MFTRNEAVKSARLAPALAIMVLVTSVIHGAGVAQAAPPHHPGHPGGPGRPVPPPRVVQPPRPQPRPLPPGRVRPQPPVGRPIVVRPPRNNQEHEVDAANLFANAFSNMRCERIGEALRRLSNNLLANARMASAPEHIGAPSTGNPGRDRARREHRLRWKRHFESRTFWTQVWDRLAETYRQCDMPCFDDGIAIGLMSGTGYCAASVAVDGLLGPGFAYQPPLPLCENSIFVGCQSGYRSAVAEFDGCTAYATGSYEPIFNEYVSQDCHLE